MNETIDAATLHRLIETVATVVIDHADELTALDQAIGDGDHGLNMKRGFEAVRAEAATLADKPLPDALRAIGTQLVMKVGGASGPLYGTLFMALGKEIAAAPDFVNCLCARCGGGQGQGKIPAGAEDDAGRSGAGSTRDASGRTRSACPSASGRH